MTTTYGQIILCLNLFFSSFPKIGNIIVNLLDILRFRDYLIVAPHFREFSTLWKTVLKVAGGGHTADGQETRPRRCDNAAARKLSSLGV